ncbi:MAG: AMP-binding protein [Chloroflexota bacterium]
MDTPQVDTLIELLEWRAKETGGKVAFTFQGEATTFAEMWEEINRFAAFLCANGIHRGEPILILLPNGREFFSAFYGGQRAGGIAVPLFPGSSAERVKGIARHCGARLLILPNDQKEKFARTALRLVSVEDAPPTTSLPDFPTVQPDDISFLQFTSGSTGNPKGVTLSHANLLTNIRQMIAGMEITEREIFVSWLPVYHDMGLILKTMVPFFLPAETHLLPTDLTNVRAWLRTIESRRATFTAAPDFAYRMAVRFVDEAIDLSSLRVALNAAEPVRAKTIRDFESKFGLRNVMTAGYGLAEATVGVSMSRPGSSPRVDARGLVSVGRPFPKVEVRIVEGESVLEAGRIGEIAIRSAANSRGYFNNPEETSRLFWKDDFLLSGDLGYVDEGGYLFIAGREKNIIKHAGETVAAQEVEEIAEAVTGVRASAAVGLDRGGLEGEQLIVFAETRERSREAWEEMVISIVEAVYARLGLRPGGVYLLKPRAIPRTYNGKIQHNLLKELFLSGTLREKGTILFPKT